jgi:hypothetical protein
MQHIRLQSVLLFKKNVVMSVQEYELGLSLLPVNKLIKK